MSVSEVVGIIDRTMRARLPGQFDSKEARVLLLATAGQESNWEHRRQVGGPARGLWQFEQIAVEEVLRNPATSIYARALCVMHAVAPTVSDCYMALANDDVFACGIARLNYWRVRDPLPAARHDAVLTAYGYYESTWRPGAKRPDDWPRNHALALESYGVMA